MMTLTEQDLKIRLHPRPIRYFRQIGSTNDEALCWLADGAEAGSAVIAGEQVKGKGRSGRIWQSRPEDSLTLSVILRPHVSDVPQITMLGALAIYDMVKLLGLSDVGIKWPNDVLLNGLKVSGVLPEAVWENGKLIGVILGMGVNVRIDFDGTELAQKAISIETVLGRRLVLIDLIVNLLERVDYWVARTGSDEIFETWKHNLLTLGQHVRIQGVDEEIAGIAETVDQNGALLIRQADGHLKQVVAGDIALG